MDETILRQVEINEKIDDINSCRNPWKKVGKEKTNSDEMKMLANKEYLRP